MERKALPKKTKQLLLPPYSLRPYLKMKMRACLRHFASYAKLADQLAIPAYIVLSDKTLHLLALKSPVIWRHLVKSVESANSRKKNTGRISWLSSTNT